jgi:hypothetical protein
MKTMTCKQLGGACDKAFSANTFDEITALSKKHGMEMFQMADKAHLDAMNEMQKIMKSPDAMNQWMASKKKEFEALRDDN